MKKWFISFIIAILPLAASAEVVQIDGLWYSIDDTEPVATVTNSPDVSYSGDIVIPASFEYEGTTYTVTGIEGIAFSGSDVEKVELPSSLTFIGDYAFGSCGRLTSVISRIESPFSISKLAFCLLDNWRNGTKIYKKSLATLYVPKGSSTMYKALEGWNMFQDIQEGDVKDGFDGVFNYVYATESKVAKIVKGNYESLLNVTIPSSVTLDGVELTVNSIGSEAFYGCEQIETLIVPQGIETIGRSAFSGCSKMKSIAFPSSLKTIEDYAFNDSHNLSEIVIPEGVNSIGDHAFERAGSWNPRPFKIELPSTLTDIGEYAFFDCYYLSAIISHIVSPFLIGKNVFAANESWNDDVQSFTMPSAKLYVPTGTAYDYSLVDGWNLFVDTVEGEIGEVSVNGITYFYFDNSLTASVFSGSDNTVTSISIPSSIKINETDYTVTEICPWAFKEYYSLKSLSIPDEISVIDENAFMLCSRLESLELPQSLRIIKKSAFQSCSGIEKLIIPSSVEIIQDYAFAFCNSLKSVTSQIKTPFDISKSVFCSSVTEQDGVEVFAPSEATLYVPVGSISSYQIIDGWKMFADFVEGELKETVFEGLNYKYILESGTATVIAGDYTSLESVTIPGTITVDDKSYTVVAIDDQVFANCENLKSVTLNEGLRTIGERAFQYCWNAEFNGLPSTVTSIGQNAFTNCSGFTKVEIPNGCTSIGREAFAGNYNLKRVELPNSLTTIDEFAFANCRSLETVISRVNSPFSIEKSVFCSSWNEDENGNRVYDPSRATLYVPVNTKPSYQAVEGWNMFADIIEGEPKEGVYENLNYSYILDSGEATVIEGDYSQLTDVVIPSSVSFDGVSYAVKTIGKRAFNNCSNLQSITLNEGLERIDDYAFSACHSAKIESFPSTLKIIGDNAFFNCNGISSLILPTGLETIGNSAFHACFGLEEVEFPSTLVSIGESAFRECRIIKLVLPASLTSIGNYAFAQMNQLSSVTSRIMTPFDISESVFCSEWSSSWDDNQQKDVYTYTPSSANLYVPEGTLAQYEAIKGWTMFAGRYEGELMETIVDGLKYTYVPSSRIATIVAGDYSELRKVTIPGNVEINGLSYQVKEIAANAFANCSQIDTILFENGIEKIGNVAFSWCNNTEFGTLPSSLKTIGDQSFWNCNSFKNLNLPEGLESIGSYAFGACHNLQKVVLPSTLTSLGQMVFQSSDKLSTVISHIQEPFEIDMRVFTTNVRWDEEAQKEIYTPCAATLYVPEGTKAKYEAFEGWRMFAEIYEGELIEQKVGDLYYSYNTSARYATVVRGDSYSELSKVEIPGSVELEGINCLVKNIASRAFSETPITSLVINEGVESIGKEAFSNCRQLATVTLPSSLSIIDDAAFRDCSRLGSVVIPSGVNTIGMSAFGGCKVLKSLDVAADNEKFESRGCNAVIERESNTLVVGCLGTVIPESVTAIGQEAFINLDIKELNIPSSVKTIGENAFNSCHQLTEVVLPEGLETLSNTAFHSCSGLTLIELPKSLKTLGGWAFQACVNLVNVVSNIEDPKGFENYVFGEDDEVYSRATLWVPKGMVDTYKKLEGWGRFLKYDELLRDTLPMPTVSYNGRYMTMQIPEQYKANIYYSTDGSVPTIQYSDTITISNLGTIQAVAKRFGSYTVDTTRYEVTYLFDGVTARTTSGGLLAKCFEWSGTDKVEMLDVAGTLNDEDFGTIRGLSKLNTLNMAASEMTTGVIPAEAFANTKLQWYVSPYTVTGVGANIFKGCDQLAAITWNSSSVELPEDVAADVANPNMLVYAKAQAMIPYTIKNVVVNGFANNIILSDSVGNNNFYCPEEFIARRISYTHNYTQTTKRSVSQGWETIALPFTVSKITHEKNGALTPIAVEGAEKPFWLYELGDNGLEAATQIRANIPYLICMPNDDDYGDEYMQGGRVTFSAQNATITTSSGTAVSHGDCQFVPTYQRVAASSDVYVLNVNEAVGDNPMGSAFIQNLREVRPFEAYSVHSTNRSRIISVSSLGGGDATGIYDMMQNSNGEFGNALVRVYSLSGKLVKEGWREDVLRTLPKGLYIINGKKIIK